MKTETMIGWKFIPVLSVFVLIFLGASVSFAAHHEKQNTTASDVKEEALETYDVLKKYTHEQRDEAMEAAGEKIEKLDGQISELQKAIDDKWQDMSKAAQKQTREAIDKLRQQRQDLSEWLGGIRYGSEEAWEEVKKGFADSYDRLEKAFIQAREDFEK